MITIELDGTELPDLKLFFKAIVQPLQFPKYTNNIELFKEQINDLSWLNGDVVRIDLINAKDFLIEEDMQVRKMMLQILISAMEDGIAKSRILVLISKE